MILSVILMESITGPILKITKKKQLSIFSKSKTEKTIKLMILLS